jgi:hypothetical protein
VRKFQGWTALTKAGAGEGSLSLYPDVRWSIAYVLLRPFFQPPEAGENIMDPDKWVFDVEDPWFPGVWRHTAGIEPRAIPSSADEGLLG